MKNDPSSTRPKPEEELQNTLQNVQTRGSRDDYAKLLQQMKALGPQGIKQLLAGNPQLTQALAGAMGTA